MPHHEVYLMFIKPSFLLFHNLCTFFPAIAYPWPILAFFMVDQPLYFQASPLFSCLENGHVQNPRSFRFSF